MYNAFDLRLIKMLDSFILKVDTLAQFESEFKVQMDKVQGFGSMFKAAFFTERVGDFVQVKRLNLKGPPDRILFDVTDTKKTVL